tara:strand:- start:157 stop:768 length:612 start_codon:yes stop_codon:yes gene_type:complete
MNKSVDINQRIPLAVLKIAIESYLSDTYDQDYIVEQLQLEYSGPNRINKSLRIINKILRSDPVGLLKENSELSFQLLKRRYDKNIILIALLNSAFPFSFEVLSLFGKYFSVQDVVSSEIIKKSIAAVYGGNRSTENGLYSVIPMFLEAGLFKRSAQGIYEIVQVEHFLHEFSLEIFKESFKVNNRRVFIDCDIYNPYFIFTRS